MSFEIVFDAHSTTHRSNIVVQSEKKTYDLERLTYLSVTSIINQSDTQIKFKQISILVRLVEIDEQQPWEAQLCIIPSIVGVVH